MSNLIFYVLYDITAMTIARTFLFKNMEVCLRFLKQNMNQLGINLKDYELYEIAEIGEETLEIKPNRNPNSNELNITDYKDQICCKEFNKLKTEYFDELEKQEKERRKNENKIPNIGNKS